MIKRLNKTIKEIKLFLKNYNLRIEKQFNLYYSVYNGVGGSITLKKEQITEAINSFMELNKEHQTDFLKYLKIYEGILNGYK